MKQGFNKLKKDVKRMDLYENYKRLNDLSLQQKDLIEKSDFDQLLKVLAQKQEIMEEIDKVDLKEYLHRQKEPEMALRQLKELVEGLTEIEEKNSMFLKEKQSKLGDELKDFNIKQRGSKGYQAANNYEAKFIDKKS